MGHDEEKSDWEKSDETHTGWLIFDFLFLTMEWEQTGGKGKGTVGSRQSL